MTSLEFTQGYENLVAYFNTKKNDTRAEIWYSRLRKFSAETWDQAIEALIDGERYFPTLGTVRALCGRLSPSSVFRDGGYVEIQLMPQELALSGDLFPLAGKAMQALSDHAKSSKQRAAAVHDFRLQMCYFAKKHGLHAKMFKDEPCLVCSGSESEEVF